MVETFAEQSPDYSLDVRGLPGTAWCDNNLLNFEDLQLILEAQTIHSIPVSEQVGGSGVPGECLSDLRGGPLGSRMFSHIEMQHSPAIMSKDEEDVQDAKGHGRYNEEVHRYDLPDMVLQKCPPSLRRRLPMLHHVLCNRCLRHLYPKLQQFPVQSRCSFRESVRGSLSGY